MVQRTSPGLWRITFNDRHIFRQLAGCLGEVVLGRHTRSCDPSPQKQGTSSLNLEIGTLEISAGTHPVRMEVTDASGMMSNSTSNLTVYDATPPSVNDAIVELTRLSGETIRLEASAADPESQTLAYSWDIDVNEDSDGDGVTNNDQDLSGPVYVVAYTEVGIYSAICTITNDNGLQTKISI